MIDFSKPVQKKDGAPAKVLARHGDYVWIDDGNGPATYRASEAEKILINVPEPVVLWHNVYTDGRKCYRHETREAADASASLERIALLKTTYSPGHATVEIVEERK
ncbi:MAG: hypothetical protein WC655_24855 [Candidatus Hydrogenedentales bacterium]|jgi:hypothetical protein